MKVVESALAVVLFTWSSTAAAGAQKGRTRFPAVV
jgi:hypothetical protein